jgi:hypothetical protein
LVCVCEWGEGQDQSTEAIKGHVNFKPKFFKETKTKNKDFSN